MIKVLGTVWIEVGKFWLVALIGNDRGRWNLHRKFNM